MPIVVTALSITPVKGTRVQYVDRIELDRSGARGNRRFYVIDEHDRMVNGKQLGGLIELVATASEKEGTLTLAFPDGRVVSAHVRGGPRIRTTFFSSPAEARLVDAPFGEALSEHLGTPLRLVEADGAVDRGPEGAISLISRASLAKLAEVADERSIDARRFRMLIEVEGVTAHAEDQWVGQPARIGDAVVRFGGHVGRCLITSRHPENGTVDLPTLDLLRDYRGELPTTEPLPFGIYGEVLEPGAVHVGDQVVLG